MPALLRFDIQIPQRIVGTYSHTPLQCALLVVKGEEALNQRQR